MKKCKLVHQCGIERGPYSSLKAAIKSCVYATGNTHREAIKRGWRIEIIEKGGKR